MTVENDHLPYESEILNEAFEDCKAVDRPEDLPSEVMFVPDGDFFPNAVDEGGAPVQVMICVLRIYPESTRTE